MSRISRVACFVFWVAFVLTLPVVAPAPAEASVGPACTTTSITCASPVCCCDGDAVASATLITTAGAPVSGRTVQFLLDGTTALTGTTNGSGVATANFGPFQSLNPGSHSFTAKFNGDGSYEASNVSTCSFSAPCATQMTSDLDPAVSNCGAPVTLTATLLKERDTKGQFVDPVPGATLRFDITSACNNGGSVTAITDSNGVASVSWSPPCADDYQFTVSYVSGVPSCVCPPSSATAAKSFSVCASVTVCKFQDCNMNGIRDTGETGIEGWPVRLSGVKCTGEQLITVDALTGPDGCYTFGNLTSGAYTVSEDGGGIVWENVVTQCETTSYCDLRTGWLGKRWQFTGAVLNDTPYLIDPCAASTPSVPFNLCCATVRIDFGNAPLGQIRACKFHDLNMNGTWEPNGEEFTDSNGDGKWTGPEQFTDLNCDGVRDGREFYYDVNGNDCWDGGEPFTDLDGGGQYDWPEFPLASWPFGLEGNRADGKPICATGLTDDGGCVTFPDIPPSDGVGFRLFENLVWEPINLGWPTDPQYRATYQVEDCVSEGTTGAVDRWQATTTWERRLTLLCGQELSEAFGNINLFTVQGIKEVYNEGMPGQSPPEIGVGFVIFLAGKDRLGRQAWASDVLHNLLASGPAPIAIPCEDLIWLQTITDANGRFIFTDLLPGHYHLTEQPGVDYKLAFDRPMLCGFDLTSSTDIVRLRNIRKGLAWKVYQVYAGNSQGTDLAAAGHLGDGGEVITAVPGVLSIDPGDNWCNFKQASMMCIESVPKNTTLTKEFTPFAQCADVFRRVRIVQQGTPNIRLWWPLMYEPPGTTWTLKLVYGTLHTVRLPGEENASPVHEDVWNWVVDVDLKHMSLYLDLLHQTSLGLTETPLISDEALYVALKKKLAEVQDFIDKRDTASAGTALVEFEMEVADGCITALPPRPLPTGEGTGIINTTVNPACCKLLVDAEYVGKKLGIFQPGR